MKDLKKRVRAGETVFACFLGIGSPITAEIMGLAGYDWAIINLEHSAGGEREALARMQALEGTPAAAVVRVESSVRQRSHGVLAVDRTAEAGARHGKATGILLPKPDDLSLYRSHGFTFFASGYDGVVLNNAARAVVAKLKDSR